MELKKGEIVLVEVAKDIYGCMVEDKGIGWSNAGFINKGDGMVVDTMYDLNFAQNLKDLCLEVSNKDPRFVVNTHANGDHIWGNQIFDKSDCIGHITLLEDVSRENPEDFQRLKMLAQVTDDDGIKQFAKFMEPFDFNGIKITPPNITFEKKMDVMLGDTKVELIHIGPAHTRGDVMVWLSEQKVLFTGDIVFNKCTPICWVSMRAWIKVLDYIIEELKPEVIVPGHGKVCTIDEVKTLKEYFNTVLEGTKKYYAQGLKDPMEISKNINIDQYMNWTEPERLYINVLSIIREIEKNYSPLNFVEISKAVRKLAIALRG
ncbi:MBL fold metallo-hydrolase [Clostridiaceae bacterium M8S5]|nr:MBL fold metallo-hydrolase [Clostridiaceae bacterium M8S5]